MKVRGAGTIEKLKGRNTWRIRFNLGQDPATGKYRYSAWRTVYGNKSKAQEELARYRQELENGFKVDAEDFTFSAFADLFISQRRDLGTYSPSTIRDGEYQVRHLNRYLKDLLLRDVDSLTINRMLAQFAKDDHSPAAVKRVYATLNQILHEAYVQDLIATNPCDKVKTPKKPKPTVNFLNDTEVSRLMVVLDDAEHEADELGEQHRKTAPRREHNFEKCQVRSAHKRAQVMAIRIGLATGARRGEVLGLVWGYVDLNRATLRIAQQMTKDGLRKPKTERGSRVVSLDGDTVRKLAEWKHLQNEYLNQLGIEQATSTPVITNEMGGFCDPDGFSQWWRKFCKAQGFEELKFHSLRHTQATLLIAQGVDIKTVQNRLGHTLASTTLDLYAGVIPAKDREAADLIGGILTARATQ
jgi:integrase